MKSLARVLRVALVLLSYPFLRPRRTLELLSSLFTAKGRGSIRKKLATAIGPEDPLSIVEPVPFVAVGREPATLNVLLPSLLMEHMTGGPNTAILIALSVAREGVPVRFVSTDCPVAPEPELRRHLEQLDGRSLDGLALSFGSAQDRQLSFAVGERDVFLATAWWTAQVAKKALAATRTKEFLYLIQEYEPLLYPWSVFWKLAIDTYSFPFRPIVNESFVLRYLESHAVGKFAERAFAERALVFEPAVDERVFFPRKAPLGQKRRLLFYARQNAPRNLYEWGVRALARAVEQGAFPAAEWELFFMGDRIDPVPLGKGQVIRQQSWEGYVRYAEILGESQVGLSLMLSPHTSYPPLEMAASGMQVVTNAFDVKSKDALERLSRNMVVVEADLDSITEGLVRASRRALEGERTDGGLALPRTWERALASLTPRIVATFRELSSS